MIEVEASVEHARLRIFGSDGNEMPERKHVTLTVKGTPAPKGSVRAFYKPGMKRAVVVKDNNSAQRSWDALVREVASAKVGDTPFPPFVDKALKVTLIFHLRRPSGHYGTGKKAGTLKPSAPRFPRVKPDVDKLARATLDSLTGIVFDDDARIADLVVRKVWAAPGAEGATIIVEELLPT